MSVLYFHNQLHIHTEADRQCVIYIHTYKSTLVPANTHTEHAARIYTCSVIHQTGT